MKGTIEQEKRNRQQKLYHQKEIIEQCGLLVVEPDYLPDSEVLDFSRVYTP
jgi:hypothetical protein